MKLLLKSREETVYDITRKSKKHCQDFGQEKGDEVDDEIKKLGVEVDHIEGRATGWILLDYNDVLVHVFQRESRQYYNIERLWNDAARIDLSDVLTED